MELLVIIVAYHSDDVLGHCLGALDASLCDLRARRSVNVTTVVVANSQADHPELYPLRHSAYEVLRANNPGFSPAVNLAFESHPGADYVLLLNPDARPHRDMVWNLLADLELHEAVIAGPLLVGAHDEPEGVSERPFHSVRRELVRQVVGTRRISRPYGRVAGVTGDARCLTGACLLVEGRFLRAEGGLDTTIRMYLEDVLLCWHAFEQRLGLRLVTRARCEHEMGGSAAGENFSSNIGLGLTLVASRVTFVRWRSGRMADWMMRVVIVLGSVARAVSPRMRKYHLRVALWAITSARAPEWDRGPVVSERWL